MKKKEYIQPQIESMQIQSDNLLAALSKTETETPPGTDPPTDGPQIGGEGDGSDAAKKYNFNAWSSWD